MPTWPLAWTVHLFLMQINLLQMLNPWTFHQSSNFSSATPHGSLREKVLAKRTFLYSEAGLWLHTPSFPVSERDGRGALAFSSKPPLLRDRRPLTLTLNSHITLRMQKGMEKKQKQSPWEVLLHVSSPGCLSCEEGTGSLREKPQAKRLFTSELPINFPCILR